MPEFSSFWQWLGWFLILCVLVKGIVQIVCVLVLPKSAIEILRDSDD
jgi:hypothetical protein